MDLGITAGVDRRSSPPLGDRSPFLGANRLAMNTRLFLQTSAMLLSAVALSITIAHWTIRPIDSTGYSAFTGERVTIYWTVQLPPGLPADFNTTFQRWRAGESPPSELSLVTDWSYNQTTGLARAFLNITADVSNSSRSGWYQCCFEHDRGKWFSNAKRVTIQERPVMIISVQPDQFQRNAKDANTFQLGGASARRPLAVSCAASGTRNQTAELLWNGRPLPADNVSALGAMGLPLADVSRNNSKRVVLVLRAGSNRTLLPTGSLECRTTASTAVASAAVHIVTRFRVHQDAWGCNSPNCNEKAAKTVFEGQAVVITCRVVYSKPHVDNIRYSILLNHRIEVMIPESGYIYGIGSNQNVTFSHTITNAAKEQSGTYSCCLINALDRNDREQGNDWNVDVVTPPELSISVEAPTAWKKENTTRTRTAYYIAPSHFTRVTIRCTAPGAENTGIQLRNNHGQLRTGQGSTGAVLALSEHDFAGIYECIVGPGHNGQNLSTNVQLIAAEKQSLVHRKPATHRGYGPGEIIRIAVRGIPPPSVKVSMPPGVHNRSLVVGANNSVALPLSSNRTLHIRYRHFPTGNSSILSILLSAPNGSRLPDSSDVAGQYEFSLHRPLYAKSQQSLSVSVTQDQLTRSSGQLDVIVDRQPEGSYSGQRLTCTLNQPIARTTVWSWMLSEGFILAKLVNPSGVNSSSVSLNNTRAEKLRKNNGSVACVLSWREWTGEERTREWIAFSSDSKSDREEPLNVTVVASHVISDTGKDGVDMRCDAVAAVASEPFDWEWTPSADWWKYTHLHDHNNNKADSQTAPTSEVFLERSVLSALAVADQSIMCHASWLDWEGLPHTRTATVYTPSSLAPGARPAINGGGEAGGGGDGNSESLGAGAATGLALAVLLCLLLAFLIVWKLRPTSIDQSTRIIPVGYLITGTFSTVIKVKISREEHEEIAALVKAKLPAEVPRRSHRSCTHFLEETEAKERLAALDRYYTVLSYLQNGDVTHHKNIIRLLTKYDSLMTEDGVFSRKMLLLEYAEHGTLLEWLHRQRHPQQQPCGYINCSCMVDACRFADEDAAAGVPQNAGITHLPMDSFHRVANQLAEGLKFLHEHQVIHNDIAPQNILMGAGEVPKICDFGMSVSPVTPKPPKTIRWLHAAVECLLNPADSTLNSDKWSFAVVLWQMWTLGAEPIIPSGASCQPEVYNCHHHLRLLKTDLRLPRPAECPNALFAAMRRCWHAYPIRRPSYEDIQRVLDTVKTECRHGVTADADENETGSEYTYSCAESEFGHMYLRLDDLCPSSSSQTFSSDFHPTSSGIAEPSTGNPLVLTETTTPLPAEASDKCYVILSKEDGWKGSGQDQAATGSGSTVSLPRPHHSRSFPGRSQSLEHLSPSSFSTPAH